MRADLYEQLGVLYLGRTPGSTAPFLLPSADLVTHAAIVGMTGSGKTGLGVAVLEEAAIDGIPALIIDPKGDLANLALTFPGLSPEEFAPFLADGANATSTAAAWAAGLAAWGQDGARIARLRAAAEVAVYTPGSTQGRPLAVLSGLAAPPPGDDAEGQAARLDGVVGSLLGLCGVEADPLASREHLLLSAIIGRAWTAGEDLDLSRLISLVQEPGLTRLGVLDLESVFPAKERLALALRLNALAASPAFAAWLVGEPLDIDRLLWTPEGRPRLAVLSIAHLDDAQRMFVVSLVLTQLVAWMRRQSGTASLRALLYMDEVAGYLPPSANPPSKPPLMVLLKQARAFGLGCVLATQNPGDLDYKALANIGVWMIGKLSTERDRSKILQAFTGDPRQEEVATALTGLGKRMFLVRNVHAPAPQLVETRWTMSYLRGPLSREHLARLAVPVAVPPTATPAQRISPLPVSIPQVYARSSGSAYGAQAFALLHVRCGEAAVDWAVAAPVSGGLGGVDWLGAPEVSLRERDLSAAPDPGMTWHEAPGVTVRTVAGWSRSVVEAAYRRVRVTRLSLGEAVSRPGEDERAFRARLTLEGREARDAAAEELRRRYGPRRAALEERLRRARAAEQKEREQARGATMDTVVSMGVSLLGAFLGGGRRISAAGVGRIATGAKSLGRAVRERGDVARAGETVAAVEGQLAALEAAFQEDLQAADAARDPQRLPLSSTTIAPRRTDIAVRFVGVLWS